MRVSSALTAALALSTSGCLWRSPVEAPAQDPIFDGGMAVVPDAATAPPPDLATALRAAGGLLQSPPHGLVVDGDPSVASLHVRGFFSSPAVPIAIEAQGASGWTELGRFVTATVPVSGTEDDPIFAFEGDLSMQAAAWPAGGLLWLHAVARVGEPQLLTSVDDDFADCATAAAGQSWRALVQTCASVSSPLAIVTSSAASPATSATAPAYLTMQPAVTPAETALYYQTTSAPKDLPTFLTTFGFDANGAPNGTTDEAFAVYYNQADLGLGRELHCKSFARGGVTGRACYSKNYGVDAAGAPAFGANPSAALVDAVARHASFATVAMVFDPSQGARAVQFTVYNGATGALQDHAQLDTVGANISVPSNCIVCHGGSARYDGSKHTVNGARFLPLDAASFVFASDAGYTRADQAESLRSLNAHVRATAPSANDPIAELIDGWYGGDVTQASAVADDQFVPTGWTAPNDPIADREHRAVYARVFRPACRTCHASQASYPFASYDAFIAAATVSSDVCGTFSMPQAEQTLRRAWASPVRAYLFGALGTFTACPP
jgi:hypothetical protein